MKKMTDQVYCILDCIHRGLTEDDTNSEEQKEIINITYYLIESNQFLKRNLFSFNCMKKQTTNDLLIEDCEIDSNENDFKENSFWLKDAIIEVK